MSVGDKAYLLEKLTEAHSATRTILKGVDLEMRVYTDTDWRIRDILGHISIWDREVTKSLRAFLAGTEYSIPDFSDENEFNEQAVIEQRQLSTQQIQVEWEQARDDFKEAIREIPSDRFPGDLLYPWGDERGSITQLIEYMIEHDDEHRDEIVKVIEASAEN
ncbi:MAG TPA: maleylpyruvate isomerase family protein [Anaerolineae bacterium]|nr:maleylpyruvate isomerase family protein [Anaerolineae bacterium]